MRLRAAWWCSIFGPCIATFGQFADFTFARKLTVELGREVPIWVGPPFGGGVVPPFMRATFAMAERRFAVLKYRGRVPAMAGCEKCERKFFTPATYSRDAAVAREYLLSKFNEHECEEKPKKSHYGW